MQEEKGKNDLMELMKEVIGRLEVKSGEGLMNEYSKNDSTNL